MTDTKFLRSSKLAVINLLHCSNLSIFLNQLSIAVEMSLKILMIEAKDTHDDYDNDFILSLLSKFQSLERLTLKDVSGIDSSFLYKIKHYNLTDLNVKNCQEFFKYESKEEIIMKSGKFTFKVNF